MYDGAMRLIDSAREIAFKPGEEKRLHRKLTVVEVCRLLGIHHSVLYGPNSPLPPGEKAGSARLFTVPEFHQIQDRLGLNPRSLYGIQRAVKIAFANHKGGVGKTNESVGFAQDSAVRGFKTLMVDLDPQASATSLLGIRPIDVDDFETLLPMTYGKARCDAMWVDDMQKKKVPSDTPPYWTGTLKTAVRPTYFPRLDVLSANLSLYYADIVMGIRDKSEADFKWYRLVSDALETIIADYDLIVMDLPPTLSFYTGSAVYAADGLLIPTPAGQLDLESTLAFLKMLDDILELAATDSGQEKIYEFLRIFISKYQAGVEAQSRLAGWMRVAFGAQLLEKPMPLLPLVQNLGPELQTIFEHLPRGRDEPKARPGEPFKASRPQLREALAEADQVHGPIFDDIVDLFKSRQAARAPSATRLPDDKGAEVSTSVSSRVRAA